MRGFIRIGVLAVLLSTATGCGDKVDLEEAAVPLAGGLDLDDNGQLHFYLSNPVFGEKSKTVQQYGLPVISLRDSRSLQDAYVSGALEGRNYQVYVLGKKLLQAEGWFKALDVLYRDSRNTVLDRIIAFDGPVEEMFNIKPEEQPMLAPLLRGMVDSKSKRGATVRTTVQSLHRQMYETALTPSMSEVTYDSKQRLFRLKGTALLTHEGMYVASIGFQESVLLNILQNTAGKGVTLSFSLPDQPNVGPFSTNRVSFSAREIETKIKSSYRNGKFHYRIKVKLSATLSEKLFEFDVERYSQELEKKLERLMKEQLEALIEKFQAHRIDPAGFGVYSRAYQYRAFKAAESRWGEELAGADFDVETKIKIVAMGPVR